MPGKSGRLAVFVVPRPRSAWKGAEAIWITISGWATAAEELLGKAVVFTSDQRLKPSEIFQSARIDPNDLQKRRRRRLYSLAPAFLKIFMSDMLLLFSRGRNNLQGQLLKEDVAFVWEQHDLFPGEGRKIAARLGVPFIIYVHAPVVWEASKWGVKRYLWGRILELLEAGALKKADCVAVVSEDVKQKVIQMGVRSEKVLVSPMAVNPKLFLIDEEKSQDLKEELNMQNKFVIGWTGSFRKFHGLDILIKSFANFSVKNPEAVLLLVGEGALKKEMEELVEQLGLQNKVIFYGKVEFARIPELVSIFDVAVVGAPQGEDFHYSPLKLREYMAAGKAVIAPRVGEIPEEFEPDQLFLYEVGDIFSLSTAMAVLKNDAGKREQIGRAGRNAILERSTWKKEVEKALKFLKIE